jgi:hypothetical protein
MLKAPSGPADPHPWLNRLGWAAVIGTAAHYVADKVFNYDSLGEERCGPYGWPRADVLFPHVPGGLLALVPGPLLFAEFALPRRQVFSTGRG